MKNEHFKKLRRLYAVSAFGSPILFFAAYLCFAGGLIWWALLPGMVGFALVMALPPRSLTDPQDKKAELPKWAGRIATFLCLLWLARFPEFWALLGSFRTDATFLDWRLIVAGGIWTFSAVYSNWRLIGHLSDVDIFSYLNREPSHIDSSSPVINTEGRRVARGCLFIVGAFVLLGVACYFCLRGPHFSSSAATSIDITMRSPRSQTAESKVLVQLRITKEPACAALFALLRSARLRMDHKCADIGTFTVRYANGKTDTLAVLPGHDPTGYEFRFGGSLYRLPRERLYQVLRDAGVDTTKMPESDH